MFFFVFLGIWTVQAQNQKWQGPSINFKNGNLKVSENHRFLEFSNGTHFFYLGDTAWELFHCLDKTDAEKYLENRRKKGFTVIQAVVLAELDGLNTPNMEGEKPLIDNNPLNPTKNISPMSIGSSEKRKRKAFSLVYCPPGATKLTNNGASDR